MNPLNFELFTLKLLPNGGLIFWSSSNSFFVVKGIFSNSFKLNLPSFNPENFFL